MESRDKLEIIDQAIKKIIAEKQEEDASVGKLDDDQILLSRLLSELESLRGDDGGVVGEPDQSPEEQPEAASSPAVGNEEERKKEKSAEEPADGGCSNKEIVAEEIVKELRNVKNQNTITHCLLSVMIVLTVAWQLSEVSLILKLKDGMSHPFKSFGSVLAGMIKRPATSEQDSEKQQSTAKENHHHLRVLDLPHVVDLALNGNGNGNKKGGEKK